MYRILFVGFSIGLILTIAYVIMNNSHIKNTQTAAIYPPVIDLADSQLSTVNGVDSTNQFFITADSGYLYKSASDGEGAAYDFIAKDPEVTNANVQGASTINIKKITKKLFPKSILKNIVINRKKVDPDGTIHIYFTQKMNKAEVFGSSLSVHIRNKKEIYAVIGNLAGNDTVSSSTISQQQAETVALTAAKNTYSGNKPLQIISSTPGVLNASILDAQKETINHPTQEVVIATNETTPSYGEKFIVGSDTGTLLYREPVILDALNRTIADCNGVTGNCPVVRSEGSGPSNIADADATYNFIGDVYNFYHSTYSRDSYDNAGARIVSLVNITDSNLGCPNAAWVGGNYNQLLVCPHMASNDIIAHEMTHAVTEHTAHLLTTNQSGALNEATSDIMATGVDNDWTMGEDSILGVIRDSADPTKDKNPHPDKLFSSYYYCNTSDAGGVHENMTVITKTFYLMSQGGSFNGCTISGIGKNAALAIWYKALTTYFTSTANFGYAYISILQACHDIYGTTADQCNQVQKAFQATQVDQQTANVQTGPKCQNIAPHAPVCASTTTNPTPTVAPTSTMFPSPTTSPISPTITECSLKSKGDADCNNILDLVDFEMWRKEFTKTSSTTNADFNQDGKVDMVDFEMWRKGKFGR